MLCRRKKGTSAGLFTEQKNLDLCRSCSRTKGVRPLPVTCALSRERDITKYTADHVFLSKQTLVRRLKQRAGEEAKSNLTKLEKHKTGKAPFKNTNQRLFRQHSCCECHLQKNMHLVCDLIQIMDKLALCCVP